MYILYTYIQKTYFCMGTLNHSKHFLPSNLADTIVGVSLCSFFLHKQ